MSRWVAALLLSGLLLAQERGKLKDRKEQSKPAAPAAGEEQVPPEEDENLKPKVYAFNPLQAQQELRTGNFYWKKGSYKAAMLRYREATRWNPGFAEAWLRLAEAQEKQRDEKAAKEAYQKYLELAPDAKNAASVRKKLGKS